MGTNQDGNQVLAWVQDQGIGIPVDQLRKIFEEFYQIEPPNTRHYGGVGNWTDDRKGIDRSAGRKIWAESEGVGQGDNIQGVVARGMTSPPALS